MISDITLGQYFPAKSPMHRTDPRMKICLTVFAIVLIFVAGNFLSPWRFRCCLSALEWPVRKFR